MKSNLSRRSFFRWSLLSLPLLKAGNVLANIACPMPAPNDSAVAKKLLKKTDSAFKRLKFVFVAKEAKGNPKYKVGANCGNCKFFSKKAKIKTADGYSKCPMVGNKYVPSCGWCKSHRHV